MLVAESPADTRLLLSAATLSAALLISTLGLWALIRRRGSALSLGFAAITGTVGMWLFCFSRAYSAETSAQVLFWVQWGNVAVTFIPLNLILVSCLLTSNLRRFRWVLVLYGVGGLIWSWLLVGPQVILIGTRPTHWGEYSRYSEWHVLFLGAMAVAMFICNAQLWNAARRSPTAQSQSRLRLLAVAFGISFLAAVDYLPAYGVDVLPLGFLAISLFVLIAGYAIVRYQLIPINYAFAAEQIVARISDAIFVCDRQGTILMGNPSASRLVGCEPARLIGHPIGRWIAGGERAEFDVTAQHEQQVIWRSDDGREHTSHVSATPLEENGELVGAVLVVHDLTDLRTAESQRRTLEDSLRQLSIAVEQSANLVLVTDLGGRIEYVNPRFTEITGFTKEEAVGQTPRILSSGETPPGVYQVLWETILSGRVWRGELLNRRKDGSRYWAHVTISPVRDAQGTMTHFIGLQEDVTDRKQAEQALRAERDRVRTYLDTAAVCLVVIDASGKVTMINRQGCRLLAAREEDIVGRDWFELAIPPEDRDRVREIHRRLMAGDVAQVDRAENYLLTRRGERRLVAWNNAVLRDESGRALATVSSGEDITERREHEHRVRQAQELLEHAERLDRIARDLAAPLRAISDGLERWQSTRDPALLAQMREAMAKVSQAIRELSDLYGPGRRP